MTLENESQVRSTRRKLALLEEHYEEVRNQPTDNEYVRDLNLRSIRRFINQLKEEIVRFESRTLAHARGN